jgi:hypothetical protein
MVFLVTFAASMLVEAAREPTPPAPSNEPLAMLGVAPSSAENGPAAKEHRPLRQPAAGKPAKPGDTVTI